MENTERPDLKRKASVHNGGEKKKTKFEDWAQVYQTGLITFYVGTSTYHVQKGLLIQQSQHFAAKEKDGWSDSETTFTLEEIANEGFKVVLTWMYEKTLSSLLERPFSNTKARDAAWDLTAKAYKAANRLKLLELQNQLLINFVDSIARTHEWNFADVLGTYTAGLRNTALYKFVLDSAVWTYSGGKKPKSTYSSDLQTIKESAPNVLKDITEAALQLSRDSTSSPLMRLHQYQVRKRSVAV